MADSVSVSSSSNSSSKEDVRTDSGEAVGGCTLDGPGSKTTCTASTNATGDSGWEKLIQKQRSELMYELRNLKHGEKPVTGKDAREKVETFLQEQTNPTRNRRPERSPSDPMVLEVQGLFERRRVTSVLGSSAFKRDLENVIRGTIIRQEEATDRAQRDQQERERAAAARIPVDDSWETLSQSSFTSAVSSQSSHDHLPWVAPPSFTPPQVPTAHPYQMMNVPPPPPVPQFTPAMNQFPPQNPWQQAPWQQQQAQWSQMQHMRNYPMNMAHPWSQMPQHPMAAPPQPMQQRVSPWQQMQRQPFPQQPRTQGWPQPPAPMRMQMPQRQQQQQQQQQRPRVNNEQEREEQREELVSEISELVHRRLVSQTLEGDVRGRLEIHLQRRFEDVIDEDGRNVADFVRSLRPSTHHRRNDFSHLGIHIPQTAEEEMAAMGHASPMLEAMRQEMEELKNMVRMNFEMQLDIQRAIRQEVAAALASVAGGNVESQTCAPASTSEPLQDGSCLICLDRGVDCVLYQCGHMCVCMTCGLRLKGQGLNCPVCRAPIRDVIRAYRCVAEKNDDD